MSADGPIAYIPRIASYYQALGFGEPYRWAHYEDVPFTPLNKPLRNCTVAVVTTAAPYQPDKGDQGPRAPYNAAAKFYRVYWGEATGNPDLRISHVSIDRDHTTAEDLNSYFPLKALRRAEASGRVGRVSARFFGLPTNRSQRVTLEQDCADLLREVLVDQADAALLVPNCPVCHQSATLAARVLEVNGIATVIMGCARDIVEHVGAPRLMFSDFPLGNGAGIPNDVASQDVTLGLALDLLEQARAPRTTFASPLRWPGDPSWKQDYSNAACLTPQEIARRCAQFKKNRDVAADLRREFSVR